MLLKRILEYLYEYYNLLDDDEENKRLLWTDIKCLYEYYNLLNADDENKRLLGADIKLFESFMKSKTE